MRICRETATQKFLEYQTHAQSGTLIANAVAAGYNAADIEEVEIAPAESAALQDRICNDNRALREDAAGLRQALGSIFAGTASQKRARWVDVIEKYPAAASILALLRGRMTVDAKQTVIEILGRVKAKIGTAAEVLTQTEYDALRALAAAKNL